MSSPENFRPNNLPEIQEPKNSPSNSDVLTIPLTPFRISGEDSDLLEKPWYMNEQGYAEYQILAEDGTQENILLHNIIATRKANHPVTQKDLIFHKDEDPTNNQRNNIEKISGVEIEVFIARAKGKTIKEIATASMCNEDTIKSNIRNVLGKISVETPLSAILFLIKNGQIDPLDITTAENFQKIVNLSARKKEILIELSTSGATNEQLSQKFIIEVDTIKQHMTAICHTLGVKNRISAAMVYLGAEKQGYLDETKPTFLTPPENHTHTIFEPTLAVLSERANGYTNKETATRLGIPITTVRSRLDTIYKNLGVHSLTEAVELLVQEKKIDPIAITTPKEKLREQFPRTYKINKSELKVLFERAKGQANQSIADTFVISEETVKSHVKHALKKLDVDWIAQALILLVQEKRLDPLAITTPEERANLKTLTKTEYKLLQHFSETGISHRELSDPLGKAMDTIKHQMTRIHGKLQFGEEWEEVTKIRSLIIFLAAKQEEIVKKFQQ